MAARKSAPKVKLRHRLPNAPAVFVGRAREIEWLDLAIRRGAVSAVTGPGGIGKTALVLRVLSERFPDRIGSAVYFGIRPGEPTAQLRYDLVRVLAEVAREKIELSTNDPEALTEAALDLAESARLLVVLDDAHHADLEEMGELLTQLATYARESRWVITSRADLQLPALRGQVLGLSAMSEADLGALAHNLSPHVGAGEIHRAVVAASGSPWLLHQVLATGSAGTELTRERLVGDLPESIEPFMQTLALFGAPMSTDVLARLTPIPDPATMESLGRRGLVVRSDAGYALHDVVAQILYPKGASSPEDAARRAHAASVLEETRDPELLVVAARLYLEAGALDALVALLEGSMETLLAEAQAPRLFAVIRDARDPRLARHQLRCAAELGNPTALGSVERPPDPGPEEHLAWATTTYGKGEVERARRLASEIREPSERAGNDRLACEAALLEARCLLHQNEPMRAGRLLETQRPSTPGLAFRRDALLARARASSHDPSVETALAELRRRGEVMTEGPDALLDVASALHELGRRESADEMLDVLLATPRGGRVSLLVSRMALLLRARIRLEAGDVALAGELVSSLGPYVRTASLLRPFVAELDAARRFAIGDLAGLAGAVQASLREAVHVDRALALRLATLAERVAIAEAENVPPSPVEPNDSSRESATLAAVRARRALRHGRAEPAKVVARVDGALLSSEHALVAGDPASAVQRADEAVHEAARAGSKLLEIEALEVALDVAIAAGADERPAIAALRDLAVPLSSARARLHAELAERFDDPGTLERVAMQRAFSPIAARRARALLGGGPPLDRVDQLVVHVWRTRSPTLRIETVLGIDPRLEWQAGYGLDARTRSVWFADGRTIDLASKGLLWRLLDALVARGGRASKEELVLGVWEERVYHPGRHDPRLHMSARKLREVLEDDAASPERLLTTEDGYRLAGVVRRVTS